MPELEALITCAKADRDIILDIANVKLIDRSAVRFLAQQGDKGITLRNCPAYIREWISRERSSNQ